MSEKLGLKDVPIESKDDEALGLDGYADVLSDFVADCDTPITVALQGDWGSGKTSLMNLIRQELDGRKRYETVWFNTWQFAQFNMSDTLVLSMMSHFVSHLSPKDSTGTADKAGKALLSLARAVAIGGASVVGHGDTVRATIDELKPQDETIDPSRAIMELKNRMTEAVEKRMENSSKEKIVVFIDDLDRLVPVKAIELLEALKLFLDIDRCVYIIACDYSVVVTGLKEKFGVAEGELKGKSFFDKIIQVPFKMPTRRYRIEKYVGTLLNKIGVSTDEKDIQNYQNLVEYSVGFNPRTMKRLFNSLLLLIKLSDKELGDKKKDMSDFERQARCRVLFGALCMQESYEPLFDHIRNNQMSDKLFVSLIDEISKSDGQLSDLRQALGDIDLNQVSDFVEAFYQCIQLDDDRRLSDKEQEHLENILKLSAVVSAGTENSDVPKSNLLVEIRRELNSRYRKYLNRRHPKIGKFQYTTSEIPPNVYLGLPSSPDRYPAYLTIWCGDNSMAMGIYSDNNDASEIVQYFCKELQWHENIANDQEGENNKSYFFEEEFDKSQKDSMDMFYKIIYEKLDQIFPKLSVLCKSYMN